MKVSKKQHAFFSPLSLNDEHRVRRKNSSRSDSLCSTGRLQLFTFRRWSYLPSTWSFESGKWLVSFEHLSLYKCRHRHLFLLIKIHDGTNFKSSNGFSKSTFYLILPADFLFFMRANCFGIDD